jgi:hypothetical protein
VQETVGLCRNTFALLTIGKLPLWRVTLIFDIEVDADGMPRQHAYSLRQTAYAKLESASPRSLGELATEFGMVEDLLKVLTGSNHELGWPSLILPDGSRCSWYFQRLKNAQEVERRSYHDTVTSFPELRDTFGAIWSRWRAIREEFGPGCYLYLGTRRGFPMYVEHRFVNLVWGLVAFHRKKDEQVPNALLEKVGRILERVEDKSDKRWLAGRLKNAHEPPLEGRLFDTLKVVPIGLDEDRLRAFYSGCAKLRNDISHFGGERHGAGYSAFLLDLSKKSEALSILYQALLLHELGISERILRR